MISHSLPKFPKRKYKFVLLVARLVWIRWANKSLWNEFGTTMGCAYANIWINILLYLFDE